MLLVKMLVSLLRNHIFSMSFTRRRIFNTTYGLGDIPLSLTVRRFFWVVAPNCNCHGWGLIIGFDGEYIGEAVAFDPILDDMFEIVGADLKLTDNYAVRLPGDEMIKTTTGNHSQRIWTKGNNLSEIQFVSYNNATDLAAGNNFTLLRKL